MKNEGIWSKSSSLGQAKMAVNVHETKSQLIHGKQSNGTTLLLLFFILRSP
jgi:hypothetical protein